MIYFDNAATTALRETALSAMIPYFREEFANPSGIYLPAGKARRAVEESREKLANLLNAQRDEIIFTSGGSESNNLAIRGFCMMNRSKGSHVITSLTEHPSVINTIKALEREGFSVTWLKPDESGIISVDEFKRAIRPETIFASIMQANNETGVIQNIEELAAAAHEKKVCFHTDAVQSFCHMKIDVKKLGVDMLSSSATENVAGIVGMATAAAEAIENLTASTAKVYALRERLIDKVLGALDNAYLNGDREKRTAGNVNFSFDGVQGESVIIRLSAKGICGSTGSACTALRQEPSHVLTAMGMPYEKANSSIRLTLSEFNTEDEVDYVAENLIKTVNDLRAIRRY
ncbi:MAG: cysteine desulfurase [Lachnospiraceae bacterium]|nr:cysteine desulfurase [Lachnospiraceae bacterium]